MGVLDARQSSELQETVRLGYGVLCKWAFRLVVNRLLDTQKIASSILAMPTMNIRIDSGIGDIIVMESHWSDSYRRSIRKMYINALNLGLLPFFNRCPTTEHIECIPVDIAHFDEWAEEWSVAHRFDEIRQGIWKFKGSDFLRYPVADISHLELPERFVVIQHQTPINSRYLREVRDLHAWEWWNVVRWLEDHDTLGVVLNSSCAEHPPDNPRVIDLIGKTLMCESLEVLKKAHGYIGIDSWLGSFAAQLFPANDFVIRCANPWCLNNKDLYYAPHKGYGFLKATIGELPKVLV